MMHLFFLLLITAFASTPFEKPKLPENLEEPPKLTQCMRTQVALALQVSDKTIWGFQGPFLVSGEPRKLEYFVRTPTGYPYTIHFTTSLHNHWQLFQYLNASGILKIGATAEDMWDEAYLTEKAEDDPIFVDLLPCQKYLETNLP